MSLRSVSAIVSIALALATVPFITDVDSQAAETTLPDPRPNVLVILTDDQRAGTVPGMPATNRLFADGGRVFTNALATTPLCCPSRASILSGRYAHNHGVRVNKDGLKLDHDTTIQAAFQRAGYKTGIAGKFLNAWPPENDPPYWDRWAIFNPTRSPGHTNTLFNTDGDLRNIRRYSTDYVADIGVDFLDSFESDDEAPWMLFLSPYAPHAPYDPPRRYADISVSRRGGGPGTREADRSDKPSWIKHVAATRGHGRDVATRQSRMLLAVDDLVSQVFARMARLDEERDTIAIFLSDNGHLWGEHGVVGKRQPYRESVEVPLLVRWPGHVTPGTVDERIAATIDVAPTLIEAAGIDAPGMAPDGRSLLTSEPRRELLLEHWSGGGVPTWASIWTQDHQYIEYYGAGGRVRFREFYDLASDPWQLRNRLRDGTRRNDPPTRALHKRLKEMRSCAGSAC